MKFSTSEYLTSRSLLNSSRRSSFRDARDERGQLASWMPLNFIVPFIGILCFVRQVNSGFSAARNPRHARGLPAVFDSRAFNREPTIVSKRDE